MNKNQIIILSILKVASLFKKNTVSIYLNKNSISFILLLYKQGIIQNFFIFPSSLEKNKFKILIYLRYYFDKSIYKNLKIISKPSMLHYVHFSDLCLIYDKKHTIFISTSKGILTNFECKLKKLGGLVLFKC